MTENTRETRFDDEILAEAVDRAESLSEENPSGVLEALGWDLYAINRLADHFTAAVNNMMQSGIAPASAIATACMEALAVGALAADITYERSMGL